MSTCCDLCCDPFSCQIGVTVEGPYPSLSKWHKHLHQSPPNAFRASLRCQWPRCWRLLSSNCFHRCHTVRGLGVMDLNWTVAFRVGRGRDGKWGRRRRIAVATEGGGSDWNSPSIKKDTEVERNRHTQLKRQWARGERRKEMLWKPSPSVMGSWKSSNCSWEECGGCSQRGDVGELCCYLPCWWHTTLWGLSQCRGEGQQGLQPSMWVLINVGVSDDLLKPPWGQLHSIPTYLTLYWGASQRIRLLPLLICSILTSIVYM